MNPKLTLQIASAVVLAGVLACYGEKTVSTSPAAISTIVAATMRAITPPAPTAVSPAPSPEAKPQPPTSTSVTAPVRINFLGGATTGIVTDRISPGQTLSYVLQAGQGQPMLVQVVCPAKDVGFSIQSQGGTWLLSPSSRQSSWKGTLPQTEDYVITLYGGASTQQCSLIIEIVSRISFAKDANSAKISAQTPAGYGVAYTVFALKDQKLDVELYGVDSNATLAIWGYADGQTYLKAAANRTSITFTVPLTQDYVIQIDPKSGEPLDYTIYIKIE